MPMACPAGLSGGGKYSSTLPTAAALRASDLCKRFIPLYFGEVQQKAVVGKMQGSNLGNQISAGAAEDRFSLPEHRRTKLVIFSGHDTNIANVAGLLGLKWKLPDLPDNDTPPAGALVFELSSDASTNYFMRVRYVHQTLTQLRTGVILSPANPPNWVDVQLPNCTPECKFSTFQQMMQAAIDPNLTTKTASGELTTLEIAAASFTICRSYFHALEFFMRRVLSAILLCLPALLPLSAASPDDEALFGFTSATSHTERDWENKFRAIPDPKNLRDYMQRLSARPHHVGSPYDKQNAEWILSQFKSWGLDAQIEQFDVLFPTPKERVLELTEPTRYTAKLQEPPVAGDPTSNQQSEQLPTYNAYSIDGDVTGKLVYVNYGLQRDYEELDRLGVSVKGAIVIARYGNSWRGIKPKIAAEHGAIGCIIYSDPRDDGYFVDDVFPNGPMRNENGVQRGSVMDMPTYPGDPTTPGVGSKGDVKRLALKDITTLTKIPTLPDFLW